MYVCSSLESHAGPKWPKALPVFRPKRCKNDNLCGATNLYGLYKWVPHSLPKNALYLVYWISQSKGDALGITLGSSVKQTSTWSKAFYCLIYLDATTFVLPSVFTLTETIYPKLLAEALPMNEKHPLPVYMRHFLQTIVARLHIPEETSYVGLSLSLVQIVLL